MKLEILNRLLSEGVNFIPFLTKEMLIFMLGLTLITVFYKLLFPVIQLLIALRWTHLLSFLFVSSWTIFLARILLFKDNLAVFLFAIFFFGLCLTTYRAWNLILSGNAHAKKRYS
ncbi:hypothetical protein [Saliterribacillus persicus]|uniref:Uncharacterized protein n=1 Tax=Saliterribacillus persicus TaxID=930114 RepID=A0A368Y0R8_9BACI|nr:hypothetical protein [Saliterribacillus persicus]RCW71844.1 hypothetical protein DFR57_10526 [Saliterribacillus persicus]